MARRRCGSEEFEKSISTKTEIFLALINDLVTAYTHCCGIVEERFLFDWYRAFAGRSATWKEFDGLLALVTDGPDYMENSGRWNHDGTSYVVSSGIADGGYLFCRWLDAKHAPYSSEEEYQSGLDEVYEKRDELLRYIESERVKILDEQQASGLEPRILTPAEIMLWSHSKIDAISEINKVKSYILYARKRTRKDVGCAEINLNHALHQTVYSISDHGPVDFEYCGAFADYCLTLGHVPDYSAEEKEIVKGLLWEAAQVLPIWRLNGHCVREVEGRRAA